MTGSLQIAWILGSLASWEEWQRSSLCFHYVHVLVLLHVASSLLSYQSYTYMYVQMYIMFIKFLHRELWICPLWREFLAKIFTESRAKDCCLFPRCRKDRGEHVSGETSCSCVTKAPRQLHVPVPMLVSSPALHPFILMLFPQSQWKWLRFSAGRNLENLGNLPRATEFVSDWAGI